MSLLDWIFRLLRVWHGLVSLILIFFFCSILLSFDTNQKKVFHDVAISTFLYPAQFVLTRINRTLLVFSENAELKKENAELRVENDVLRQNLKQLPRLQDLEEFQQRSEFSLKLGQIISQDPGRFSSTWKINLGLTDSVAVNMPVLTSRGIVGKVAKAYQHHSLIQLLLDPACKVSVMSNRTRATGILESFQTGKLVARFSSDAELVAGDTLITSGMGGVFPKGLSVGVITGEELDSSDILLGLEVKPFQNPYLVEEVFVLLREDSWTVREGQ